MPPKDKLFLLAPDFEDPAYPNTAFYCWHCALMEGLIASFPYLNEFIDVQRVSWPKPRQELVSLLGENHQSTPVLVYATNPPSGVNTRQQNGIHFVDDKDELLRALSISYGIPSPHP
ncbi:DUF3088 domain-containing protein [Yoonia sp. GPGPB17]|uniref:DUF3088 domain-containing protein n=1 Tax=Yoonia sp. GPGPB17 TaxID=3026147 RepID=UPI004040A53C